MNIDIRFKKDVQAGPDHQQCGWKHDQNFSLAEVLICSCSGVATFVGIPLNFICKGWDVHWSCCCSHNFAHTRKMCEQVPITNNIAENMAGPFIWRCQPSEAINIAVFGGSSLPMFSFWCSCLCKCPRHYEGWVRHRNCCNHTMLHIPRPTRYWGSVILGLSSLHGESVSQSIVVQKIRLHDIDSQYHRRRILATMQLNKWQKREERMRQWYPTKVCNQAECCVHEGDADLVPPYLYC